TVSATASGARSATASRAPSRAKTSAAARPIPPPAPVISAAFASSIPAIAPLPLMIRACQHIPLAAAADAGLTPARTGGRSTSIAVLANGGSAGRGPSGDNSAGAGGDQRGQDRSAIFARRVAADGRREAQAYRKARAGAGARPGQGAVGVTQ